LRKVINRAIRVARTTTYRVKSKFARVNTNPVFVLGNQKSGTTAIAKLLSQATGLSVTIDFEDMPRKIQQCQHITDIDLGEFIGQNKVGFSRDIIKDPNMTFLYNQLLACFPESKVIFINRDPRENIRSMLDRLSLPGNLTELKQTDMEYINPMWGHVLNPEKFGIKSGHYIENLAIRWNLAADIYLQYSDNITLVCYESFLQDKVGAITRLAHSIGLDVVYDVTNKIDKQYQGRGKNRGFSWYDYFGPTNLARIEEVCESHMQQFGYEKVKNHV
jgi:hypothetical protein